MTIGKLAAPAGLGRGGVAIVFGTRPEIIKLAGIIELLGPSAHMIFSGQHFDPLLSEAFFDELDLRPPDVMLAVGGRSRAQQVGELVLRLEDEFSSTRPAIVVVQGDTNTTLGGALAANTMGIPLVHVEAGLRSFDRDMPEEHNRVVTDHLADLCLAPTSHSRGNLLAEGVASGRVAVTGNTVIDVALRLLPSEEHRREVVTSYGLEAGAFVLATFHRPENVDDPERLHHLIEILASLRLPVLFPAHPRTRQRIQAFGLDVRGPSLSLIPPIGYTAFLALAAECAFLLSDSGGVQEEATVVKRPAIVVRRSTERPEVLGTFAVLVPSLAALPGVIDDLMSRLAETHEKLRDLASPYGDGRAAARCVHHIELALSSRRDD